MESERHMLTGIARLQDGDWEAALGHFERALEIRQVGRWRDDPQSAWILAAAWINRSDALRQLGRTHDGIQSLDCAIDAMNHVPLEKNSGYADRLILAWINRATACGEIGCNDEALAAFSQAESLLADRLANPSAARRLLASMLHANRARILLDLGRLVDGWSDSRTAVALTTPTAWDGESAVVGICARGIHCRALAMLLDDPAHRGLEPDWIARATDLVEEALEMARRSGYQGEWLDGLVRYGARIYRICQPHFLVEFIGESLPPTANPVLRRQLGGELILAKVDLELRVREHPHDNDLVAREIRLLENLQQLETKLAGVSMNPPPLSRRKTTLTPA